MTALPPLSPPQALASYSQLMKFLMEVAAMCFIAKKASIRELIDSATGLVEEPSCDGMIYYLGSKPRTPRMTQALPYTRPNYK